MENTITSPDIIEAGEDATINLLPEKSKILYLNAYDAFKKWKESKNTISSSEDVLLVYFTELSKKYKPSSLWSIYSMLKSTINLKETIRIESYSKLSAFLKSRFEGYQPKQANTFSPENIKKFLSDAEDVKYLPTKVALILGIMGACRSYEMYSMKITDIQDLGSAMIVNIPQSSKSNPRKFTVTDHLYSICKKYLIGRSPGTNVHVFQQYRNGKVTKQRIGINAFIQMGRDIANFLKLEHPEQYTGHSLRRSSATILVDAGGDITSFKRHAGWKSAAVSEGYLDQTRKYNDELNNKVVMTVANDAECANFYQIPLETSNEATITSITSSESEYSSISKEQATNIVNTWVQQLMELKPVQQSQTIALISNILNQRTSKANLSSQSFETSHTNKQGLPSETDSLPEFVAVSNWPVKDEPSEDINYNDDLAQDWSNNLELYIDVEPTSIAQKQLEDKNDSNNLLDTSTPSVTKILTESSPKRKRSLSTSDKEVSEEMSITGLKVPKLDSNKKLIFKDEEKGISEEQAVVLCKTWAHQLMQLRPSQQQHVITVINNILYQESTIAGIPKLVPIGS